MRAIVLTGIVTSLLCLVSTPGWAQIYGPDGEELPPVPQTPPGQPEPRPPANPVPTPTPTPATDPTWQIPAEEPFSYRGRRPWRIGVTLGGFVPVGALADRSGGNIWPSFALSYETRLPTRILPFTLTGFLEGMAASRRFRNEFGDLMNEVREIYGLGVEARGYIHPPGPIAFYSGAGVGAYYMRRGVRYDSTASPFIAFDESTLIDGRYSVRPGYKFMVGLEEKHGFFFEVRYLNAGSLEGMAYQGVSAHLGGRF